MNSSQPQKFPLLSQSNPSDRKSHYAIRIKGCLSTSDWSEWFGGMIVEANAEHGETRLEGELTDQAELYGLLNRLRNLGLVLISVELLPIPKKENRASE